MADSLLEIRELVVEATYIKPGCPPQVKRLIDQVDLSLAKGKVLGVIGESGAGKSTIGLSAMGYGRSGARLIGGNVVLNGRDIIQASPGELRRLRGCEVTYVSQSAASSFNPAKRLLDQVIESSLAHKILTRGAAEERAVGLFRKLGLPDPASFGNRYPHQVSGGQLQRAMTAMALCPMPDLVIFDEPTTALDVTTQIDVLIAIKEAIKDTGVGALYISHDLPVVAQIADEILVLRDGRKVEHGVTEQIITNPCKEYTKALVSVRHLDREPRQASAPILRISGVSANYPRCLPNVLENVSLTLSAGQTLAVVGESGSGKSTLARVITGLLPPRVGHVSFDGRSLAPDFRSRSRQELREIQLVYQSADTAMNPRQTVRTIIGRPLELYFRMTGSARDARVQELLDQIELGDGFADRYPAELSGGQKQRVCIARALAAQPRMIICDEVISALDPLVAQGILKLLQKLQAETDVAYLFITHDLAAVRSIADTVAVMHKGKLVRYGEKASVFAPPFDEYTDALLSSVPELECGWLEKIIRQRRRLN